MGITITATQITDMLTNAGTIYTGLLPMALISFAVGVALRLFRGSKR